MRELYSKEITQETSFGKSTAIITVKAAEKKIHTPNGIEKEIEITQKVEVVIIRNLFGKAIVYSESDDVRIIDSITDLEFYEAKKIDKEKRCTAIGNIVELGDESYFKIKNIIKAIKIELSEDYEKFKKGVM